ncbi:hypothetical protein DESUT3_18210 [Desulfuromonas versatilis]|uniref:DUF177 domain-containing protein n=1 Tax=Desulfuromonas versatilis TaxID=2802975 RepID=A0ABM8HS01_9BACT|nr:DUF177 domain-containing protein [Desulfuromonas versatilis]BCR04752.1 hypothetical protein DESUT3_18210 [Desulfuromonas versatilis]
MLIHVDDIKEKGLQLEAVEEVEGYPGLQRLVESGELVPIGPVVTAVQAFRVGGMIEVDGQVQAGVRLGCGRCLQEFDLPLRNEFHLTFVRELPEVAGEAGEDGAELSAEDMGLILFEGDELELREAIEEQVLMALPLRPLCSEQCKGLCPQCGIDLNQGQCNCPGQDFNLKFAALRDFKVKKEQ